MKKLSGKLLTACLVMILLTALCAACALADTVSTVKITLDTAALDLSTNWTEGEVDRRLGGASGVTTPGVWIDSGNTRLLYMFNGSYSGVGSGTERVTAERDYLYRFWLRVNDGSDWARGIISCTDYTSAASNTSLKIYLNGTQRTDAVYRYNEYWNGVEVIIPAPALPKVTSLELRGTNWVLTKGDSFRYPVDITAEMGRTALSSGR